jgi:hypothetical protein
MVSLSPWPAASPLLRHTSLGASANAVFLYRYAFAPARPGAKLFVPLLRDWAVKGEVVHGKQLTVTEAEEASRLSICFL